MTAAARPFSPATLGERWGCSAQHIRDMVARGDLKAFRAGVLIRIPAAEVARVEDGVEVAKEPEPRKARRIGGADARLV
ncbi:helix-turn-helix domain-containing protein [Salipiger pacificus]|nr:helix-turn-helix domain-containing protein [Alloyangia pacifica]